MHRDNRSTLDELRRRFIEKINATCEIEQYLDNLQKLKSRYFRDILSTLLKKSEQYSTATISRAIELCYQKEIYRFRLLLDTIETIRIRKGEELLELSNAIYKDEQSEYHKDSLCPEKSNIQIYDSIFN